EGKRQLAVLKQRLAQQEAALEQRREQAGRQPDKKTSKVLRRLRGEVEDTRAELAALREKLAAVDNDPALARQAA
ncbi:MAG: hypothetical protein GTO03_08630, partial [Planctomycetales bacterium]|nr:hypothetical protein [Planctomycetales bacterium]